MTVSVKRPPTAAVTVTLINLAEPEESVIDVWFKVAVGPVGEVIVERAIVPENPLRLEMVRVVLPEVPAVKVRVVGLAVNRKSNTEMFTVT